jgi:hypothetical protein
VLFNGAVDLYLIGWKLCFKLKSLTQDESRIRSGCVSKRYVERRDEALAAAEDDRLAGKPGPRYLAGIKGPWNTGHGTVLRNYDDHQLVKIQELIVKIKRNNAELCKLEYTATKGGPGGQARH